MFTVTWSQPARTQLARIWVKSNSVERREITDYTAELDRHLRANADRIGESREPGVRAIVEKILGCEFAVSPDDRLVTVKRIWSIR